MSFGFNSSRYLRCTSLECDCLSPALVLGQQDAKGAGITGTRLGDRLKADKDIIFAFWKRTRKKSKERPKYLASNF